MKPSSRHKEAESGNALFIVLIGIILLAALTYSVMRSGRATGNLSQETITFAASSIMRTGDDMHAAVQTIMNGGNDVSTLSFGANASGAGAGTAYDNGNAVTASKVFDPQGGGAKVSTPDTAWLDSAHSARAFYGKWYFPKNVCVPFVGSGGDGVTGVGVTTCNANGSTYNELVMILPYVNASICTYIDQKLGIDMSACGNAPCPSSATLLPTASSDEFAGTFSNGKAIFSATSPAAFNGKFEGCIQDNTVSPSMYFYYKVLFER